MNNLASFNFILEKRVNQHKNQDFDGKLSTIRRILQLKLSTYHAFIAITKDKTLQSKKVSDRNQSISS